MKKELDRYDMLVGLGEYDEWSYCANDEMWYEDEKEILPMPQTAPDKTSFLDCEIKIDYVNDPEADWEEADYDNEIENYIKYLIDGNLCDDAICSVILFKSEKYEYNCTINQYSMMEIEDFIHKLKTKEFATQYMEDYNATKLLGWNIENNQVRFAIQSYHHEYNYLKILFDIVIDKNLLIAQLEKIINIWKETIYFKIKEQEKILKKPCTNPYQDSAINHFFPEFRTPVKTLVESVFRYYERDLGLKILFAVENGSRAWNIASKDSDYDIRFVYKRKTEDYISLKEPPKVIEQYYNEERCSCKADEALIDMVGFDITKYVELLSKSNPTAIEWLMSDTIYRGNNNIPIKQYVKENFNPHTLIYHYTSLCKKEYNKFIKNNKKATCKRYLYMTRGILNALYVYKKDSIPPLDFTVTLKQLKNEIPVDVYNKVEEIIQIKTAGQEKETIEQIPELDAFIEEYLNKTYNVPERNLDYEILNDYIYNELLSKNINIQKKIDDNKNNQQNTPQNLGWWVLIILFLLVFILTLFNY